MKLVYFDMDDTLCDFSSHYKVMKERNPDIKYPQSQYGFFTDLKPIDNKMGLIMNILSHHYDVWIATRPSVHNPLCYTEKRIWVEKNLGFNWCHKLILIPDKTLLIGDYLVDDVAWDFNGELIQFGSSEYPDLTAVYDYLMRNI